MIWKKQNIPKKTEYSSIKEYKNKNKIYYGRDTMSTRNNLPYTEYLYLQ